jgi:hypothetical protein
MASIPATLRRLLEDRDRDLLDQPDPDEAIALIVEDMVQVMLDQTGITAEQLLATPELVEPLGGAAYVEAVLAWRAASLQWMRSRRRQKGQPPEPPKVP